MNEKKKYWEYVKENKGIIISLTIFASLLSIFSVAFAYFSKLLIDSIGDNDKFLLFAILMVGLIVIELITRLAMNLIFNKSEIKLENNIKKKTFLSYLNNDYLTLDNKDNADYLNRITSDSKVIANGVITYLPNFVSLIFRILLSFVTLLFIDWKFALVLLGLGILTFIISKLIRPISKKYHKESQKEEGNVLGHYKRFLQESFLIKLYGIKDKVEVSTDEIQEKYYKARNRQRNFSTYINTGFSFLMRFAYIGAIIYVGVMIGKGSTVLGFGSMLAMVELIGQIQGPFTSLSSLLPKYYQTLGSIERIEEYVKEDELVNNENNEVSTIKVEDVSFKYNDKEVISHLSFEINKNDFVFIKGRSGIGKSTLLKLIMGAYKPSNGLITMNNENISNYTKLFSYVPQTNLLVKGTIKDNLELFSTHELDIDEILDITCLKDKVNSLKNGLNTSIYDEGNGLSIGEGQRLSIARALLSNRKVLVLDECTSALDNETGDTLLSNLKKLDLTIILVSHKLEHMKYATKVIELSKED